MHVEVLWICTPSLSHPKQQQQQQHSVANLAQVAKLVRSALCNRQITGTQLFCLLVHTMPAVSCALLLWPSLGNMIVSHPVLTLSPYMRQHKFVLSRFYPGPFFRHSGMEHGVGGSVVACRCRRFACVPTFWWLCPSPSGAAPDLMRRLLPPRSSAWGTSSPSANSSSAFSLVVFVSRGWLRECV